MTGRIIRFRFEIVEEEAGPIIADLTGKVTHLDWEVVEAVPYHKNAPNGHARPATTKRKKKRIKVKEKVVKEKVLKVKARGKKGSTRKSVMDYFKKQGVGTTVTTVELKKLDPKKMQTIHSVLYAMKNRKFLISVEPGSYALTEEGMNS